VKVPFVDLKRQYLSIKPELESKLLAAARSTNYILGSEVEEFEKEFAYYCGVKYAIGVASGTDALVLALKALGIGCGDEVITVPNTFIATVDAIHRNGAKPVFIDVDPITLNLNVDQIEKKISKKTKAIIVVHLYGQPAELTKVLAVAQSYNLKVIEDACQAHGAVYEGKRVGSYGDVGCFSFYPAKNLGAMGDGGIVVTNSSELAEKLKLLRNYGQKEKNIHKIAGFNSRLDELQAAILKVKLKHLDAWNEKRRKLAEQYTKQLSHLPVNLLSPIPQGKHVYHLYVIKVKQRNKLKTFLEAKGVSTGIHYPIPIHLQQAYSFLGYDRGSFPHAEQAANEILSLPMFPELSQKELNYVVAQIEEFFSR